MYSAIALLNSFDRQGLEGCLRDLTAKAGIGFSKIAQPIRVAITGRSASAGIFETMELLGKETTLKRLENTIKNMDGITNAVGL